jgi:hypothetical protein
MRVLLVMTALAATSLLVPAFRGNLRKLTWAVPLVLVAVLTSYMWGTTAQREQVGDRKLRRFCDNLGSALSVNALEYRVMSEAEPSFRPEDISSLQHVYQRAWTERTSASELCLPRPDPDCIPRGLEVATLRNLSTSLRHRHALV